MAFPAYPPAVLNRRPPSLPLRPSHFSCNLKWAGIMNLLSERSWSHVLFLVSRLRDSLEKFTFSRNFIDKDTERHAAVRENANEIIALLYCTTMLDIIRCANGIDTWLQLQAQLQSGWW